MDSRSERGSVQGKAHLVMEGEREDDDGLEEREQREEEVDEEEELEPE